MICETPLTCAMMSLSQRVRAIDLVTSPVIPPADVTISVCVGDVTVTFSVLTLSGVGRAAAGLSPDGARCFATR